MAVRSCTTPALAFMCDEHQGLQTMEAAAARQTWGLQVPRLLSTACSGWQVGAALAVDLRAEEGARSGSLSQAA